MVVTQAQWDVEEHTGGREGVGKGPQTGSFDTEAAAILAMCAAKVSGNGATCIVRWPDGHSSAKVLGLVGFHNR